jgi:predicted SAM-dependent methyltransferase
MGGRACRRLNWGCGTQVAPGWVNVDRIVAPGVDVCHDIREGLPLASASFDYAVSMHALQALPFLDVVPALVELRRVLKARGVLRLGLPDLDRAVAAYERDDAGYFHVPDADVVTVGGKLAVQISWYGSVRTPFTHAFIEELLARAGFARPTPCRFGETRSRHAEIVALDNRERESLFVEGWTPADGR